MGRRGARYCPVLRSSRWDEAFRRELRTLGPGAVERTIRLCRRLHPPLCSLSRGAASTSTPMSRSAQTVRRPARPKYFAAIETKRKEMLLAQCRRRLHFGNGEVLTDGLFPTWDWGLQSGAFSSRQAILSPTLPRLVRKPPFRMRRRNALTTRSSRPTSWHTMPAGRLKYKDVAQELDEGIRIHPSPTIAGRPCRESRSRVMPYTIASGSWRPAVLRGKKRWYSRWWKSTMRGLGLQ